MAKVIKLTENDLLNIVKMVINEQSQSGYHTLEATTDPTRIVNASVLQNAGLPCDETNFKKMWISTQLNDVKYYSDNELKKTEPGTWSKRDLSQFRVSEQAPPSEDYFAVKVYKKVKKPDNTGWVADPNRESKVLELKKGEGTKTFDTYYTDPNDPNVQWVMGNIMAAGNGLLALARGLRTYQSPGQIPNRITIGFAQSQRVSASLSINPGKINNVGPFWYGYGKHFVEAALRKNGITSKYPGWDPNLTFQEKSNYIINTTYVGLDKLFIPEQELATYQPKLTQIDKTKITNLLNSIPTFKSPDAAEVKRLQRQNSSTERIAARAGESLGGELDNVLGQYINLIRESYITRYKEFIQLRIPQEQQQQLLSSINPTPYNPRDARISVEAFLHPRVGTGTGQSTASAQTNTGTYERGASK